MSSILAETLLIYLSIRICNCMTISTTLTPEISSKNGITLETISGVTNYGEREWDLYAIGETKFNMKLHLNKIWSFDPNFITRLKLEIGSDTLTHTFPNSLIISFSQNNLKYITSVIQIAMNDDHYIYPPIINTNTKQIYGIGNIKQLVSLNINTETRISKATNHSSYGYFNPFIRNPNISYPLTFTLLNNPILNEMKFTYFSPSEKQRSILYFGMETNQTFDIYLSAGRAGDNFDITYFNFTRSVFINSHVVHSTIHNNTTTTQYNVSNNRTNNSFQKIMAFILISVVIIVCCLCIIFAIIFTKILKNHKKAMNTIQKPVIKAIDISEIKHVHISSQPATNSTDISSPIPKTILLTPITTNNSSKDSKDSNNRKLTIETDLNNITITSSKELVLEDDLYECDTDKELEDMYDVPNINETQRTTTGDTVSNSYKNKMIQLPKTQMRLNNMISVESFGEGTISPYGTPVLQYVNAPKQNSITPYIMNEYDLNQ
eukprot:382953_1